jgi:hypothetical protein
MMLLAHMVLTDAEMTGYSPYLEEFLSDPSRKMTVFHWDKFASGSSGRTVVAQDTKTLKVVGVARRQGNRLDYVSYLPFAAGPGFRYDMISILIEDLYPKDVRKLQLPCKYSGAPHPQSFPFTHWVGEWVRPPAMESKA